MTMCFTEWGISTRKSHNHIQDLTNGWDDLVDFEDASTQDLLDDKVLVCHNLTIYASLGISERIICILYPEKNEAYTKETNVFLELLFLVASFYGFYINYLAWLFCNMNVIIVQFGVCYH